MENDMNKLNQKRRLPNAPQGNAPNNMPEIDLSWIDGYIKNLMANAIPNHNGNTNGMNNGMNNHHYSMNTLKANVFETHDYMIARILIPEDIYYNNVRVWFDTNQLIISGLPNNKTQRVMLPLNGKYTGAQGYFKDNYLEVRIPKETEKHAREIEVKYV